MRVYPCAWRPGSRVRETKGAWSSRGATEGRAGGGPGPAGPAPSLSVPSCDGHKTASWRPSATANGPRRPRDRNRVIQTCGIEIESFGPAPASRRRAGSGSGRSEVCRVLYPVTGISVPCYRHPSPLLPASQSDLAYPLLPDTEMPVTSQCLTEMPVTGGKS